MKKKDLILGAGIIVIALAMLLVMRADERGRRKSNPGYAGWENLWNVFLSKDQTIEVKDGDFITGSGSKTERRIWKRQTAGWIL